MYGRNKSSGKYSKHTHTLPHDRTVLNIYGITSTKMNREKLLLIYYNIMDSVIIIIFFALARLCHRIDGVKCRRAGRQQLLIG